jgi:hypothetical protein
MSDLIEQLSQSNPLLVLVALPVLAFILATIFRYFSKSSLSPFGIYLTFLSAQNLNPLINRRLEHWAKKRDNKAKIASLKAQLDNDVDNVELYKALARCYVIAGNQRAKAFEAWEFVFNNQPDAREAFDYLLDTAVSSKDFAATQVLVNKVVNCVDIEIIQMILDDLQQYFQQIDAELKTSDISAKSGLHKAQNTYIQQFSVPLNALVYKGCR